MAIEKFATGSGSTEPDPFSERPPIAAPIATKRADVTADRYQVVVHVSAETLQDASDTTSDSQISTPRQLKQWLQRDNPKADIDPLTRVSLWAGERMDWDIAVERLFGQVEAEPGYLAGNPLTAGQRLAWAKQSRTEVSSNGLPFGCKNTGSTPISDMKVRPP